MNINVESYGHAVIFNLKGELTEDSLTAFKQAVEHQLESKEVLDVVVNLEMVSFADSAALEYLLDLQDRLSRNLGRVKLARPDENLRQILTITRLEANFEVFDDIPQALQAGSV